MRYMTANEIRKMFLDFWASKDHMIEPGASLIPHEDPTLLWINSGVAAIKKYFDGSVVPPNPRITNAQKSIRTNDIENVGNTARHHTFFEMLGNFSIGDYFREEAIAWAWELLTSPQWFAFPKDLLYVTVYPTDEDSYNAWLKLGVPAERIIRLEENFWEIGAGPCGPCTEIFFDRGVKYDPENIGPRLIAEDIENDRYIEIWNVVLSQFNSDPAKERHEYLPLPSQNIDTGMGLERMACVIQGVDTNFETDLFKPIIDQVAEIAKVDYKEENHVSFKIIADHVRTVTFAVTDGAMLSNEGRGYVLRRLLRRAVRHGKKLGISGAFMFQLVGVVAKIMEDFYPEVTEKQAFVAGIIKEEEDRFLRTLADGEKKFNELATGASEINGADAFMLYDTFGFPFELTVELAEEAGLTVDKAGFDTAMEEQKARARSARGEMEGMAAQNEALLNFDVDSEFVRDQLEVQGKVLLLLKDGQVVDHLEGDGQIILDRTPFYATSGGQIHDDGQMENSAASIEVKDVTPAPHGQHLHTVHVFGKVSVGDELTLRVISSVRRNIIKNHTATHLLHQALKDVLGEHVNQAGSLVRADDLRFDLTHTKAIEADELAEIERLVNQKIFLNLQVEIAEMSLDAAKAKGAMALFGEKYDADNVRVVSISDYSVELCGGLHVASTSEIGLFKIKSESGIGAGVRRIEAVTSEAAVNYLNLYQTRFNEVAQLTKAKPDQLESRIEGLLAELKESKREIESLKSQLAGSKVDELLNDVASVGKFNLLTARIDGLATNDLKSIIDEMKQKMDIVVMLASVEGGKVMLACGASKSYVKDGVHSGNLVKTVAQLCGGNGGGRPDLATAGASKPEALEAGFAEVAKMLENL